MRIYVCSQFSSDITIAPSNYSRLTSKVSSRRYFDTVAYANLWEGHCHRVAGLGHAPFWEAPGNFDPILERFLQDAETG
jgi:hypothetical protein